jgi:hypothetical protein
MKRKFFILLENSEKENSKKIFFLNNFKRENKNTMNKEEVKTLIDETSFYKVTFIKQNGDIRDMLFTISKAVMEKHGILPQGKRSYNDNNALRVVEITADGKAQWRSFCYSSVISLEKVE